MLIINFQSGKYLAKVYLIGEFIENFTDKTPEELIQDSNWHKPEICLRILHDEPTQEDIRFMEQKLKGLYHLKDERSFLEYALDLILGWIVEDFFLDLFKNELKLNCTLDGTDKNREFLARPRSTSDLKIETESNLIYIDILYDATSHWRNCKSVELRDNKFNNLKSKGSILLGLDLRNKIFLILDLKEIDAKNVHEIMSHKPFGWKPAISITIYDNNFYDYNSLKKYFKDISSTKIM